MRSHTGTAAARRSARACCNQGMLMTRPRGYITRLHSRKRVPAYLRPYQLPIRHPVRRVRIGTFPSPKVSVVFFEVAFEPHHLAVPLERKDVRRDPIQEPPIVA